MLKVLIGCDPEGFITRKDGRFVSAAGFFPGTKKEPKELEDGAVQVDGVALEFNIIAADNAEVFAKRVKNVIAQLDEMVVNTFDKDHKLSFVPVAKFDPTDWKEIPDTAKVLGCDPDYNALTGAINVNPIEALGEMPLRTAAGHIHIGWTEKKDSQDVGHKADCKYIAHGFYSRYLNPFVASTKEEQERLRYYGHHGSYRCKPYGVELRSPSNLWVGSEQGRLSAFSATRNIFKTLTGF